MAYFALILWPFLATSLFFMLGPGRGLIWSVAVGYLVLPEAMAIDFPGLPIYDKVSAISLAALLGVILTRSRMEVGATLCADPKITRRLLAMLFVVCFVVPLGTWLTNPETLVNGPVVRPSLGVSDALKGQSPVGFLCLSNGVNRPHGDITAECVQRVRDQIGPVAAFKQAVVVNRLPKTRSGKILRGTMRKIADGEAWRMPATIDDPAILDEIETALAGAGYAKKA